MARIPVTFRDRDGNVIQPSPNIKAKGPELLRTQELTRPKPLPRGVKPPFKTDTRVFIKKRS